MSLEKFDHISKKQNASGELIKLVWDVMYLGMEEFSKTLGKNFSTPKGWKGQIPRKLDMRENAIIETRTSA